MNTNKRFQISEGGLSEGSLIETAVEHNRTRNFRVIHTGPEGISAVPEKKSFWPFFNRTIELAPDAVVARRN